MTEIERKYNKWNKQCRKEYESLFSKAQYTIWDGVVFPDHYAKSSLKILFLNREPYDEDKEEYDLAETLQKQLNSKETIFKRQNNLRKRLKEYLCVINLLQTGELTTLSEGELVNRVKEETQTDQIFNNMMPSVAYINVKKSDGQERSYVPDLRENALQGLSILKKQILYFNPSIILAGNVIDGILENIGNGLEWGENLFIPKGERNLCIWQLKINDILFPLVDMYHPSAPQERMSTYYLDLFHALKEVAKSHPNYWEKRLHLPCFKEVKSSLRGPLQ